MSTTYQRGVLLGSADSGITNFVWQKTDFSMKADMASIASPKGNIQKVEYFNHIAELKVDAVFAKEDDIPHQGQTVTVTGIKLPAISEAGVITGTLEITGDVADTVKFNVTDVSIPTEGKEYTKVSLTLNRYIQQGVPA